MPARVLHPDANPRPTNEALSVRRPARNDHRNHGEDGEDDRERVPCAAQEHDEKV